MQILRLSGGSLIAKSAGIVITYSNTLPTTSMYPPFHSWASLAAGARRATREHGESPVVCLGAIFIKGQTLTSGWRAAGPGGARGGGVRRVGLAGAAAARHRRLPPHRRHERGQHGRVPRRAPTAVACVATEVLGRVTGHTTGAMYA